MKIHPKKLPIMIDEWSSKCSLERNSCDRDYKGKMAKENSTNIIPHLFVSSLHPKSKKAINNVPL
jgi:hypothetical protein